MALGLLDSKMPNSNCFTVQGMRNKRMLFLCITEENLLFGLMEISTMEEAILVKHLGTIHFLKRKISLSKTSKSGLLNKYCAVCLSKIMAQT